MATYVFSDVHGHAAPLARALTRIDPSEDDVFYCLGDMIDRGPDPLGVIELVRSLPNCHVLMGNHEDLMLACMSDTGDDLDSIDAANWGINGGIVTSEALASLTEQEADEEKQQFVHTKSILSCGVSGVLPLTSCPLSPKDDACW